MTMAGSFTRQTGRILVALALVGAVGWWLLQPRPSDRERLEELVARAQQGFENRSVGEIMSCVAQDYRDDSGLTRAEVLYLADKLVEGRRLVGLEERFAAKLARHGADPVLAKAIQTRWHNASIIAARLEQACGLPLGSITEPQEQQSDY